MITNANRSIRVFLCHASNDKPSVRKLYEKLIEDHIDVWFDVERLLPGQDWDVEIQKAVRMSDIVIICLSNKSVTKEGYVQKEIRIALDVADEKPDGTIFIIPVRLENCSVPDRLKRWQWIDLFSPFSEIDSNNYSKFIQSLELRSKQLKSKLHTTSNTIDEFGLNTTVLKSSIVWNFPSPEKIFNNIGIPQPNRKYIEELVYEVESSLSSLGVPSQIVMVRRGPRFTRFGIEPLYKDVGLERAKVSVSEIMSIADDLAMMLGVKSIQIELVHKSNYIGIDIPNEEFVDVKLLNILEEETYKSLQRPLTIALGRDVVGEPIFTSLSLSPNILIGGMTNSGKSTCLTSIISSLLLNSPNEIKMLFIDMRRVEFSAFFDIPHLLAPVIIDKNMVVSAFDWLLQEVENRKILFANQNSRSLEEYNFHVDFEKHLPFIVVFIGELSDLMTPLSSRMQATIAKIAGLARVTGIYLIMSTQRLTNDVVTETVKQNFSNRIVFKTVSRVESLNFIEHPGAERLLGRGDMLFLEIGKDTPTRLQGVYVSDDEISRLVEFWKNQIN